MSRDNKKHNISFLDGLGGLLLLICAVSLIVALVVFISKTPDKPSVNALTLTIQTDSTGVLDANSVKAIDSLTAVVKQQDLDVRERYAYFIEQKERENFLITFGGIIVSIILGIFGFFGYRSFKSIEEKALINAEDKVRTKVAAEFDAVKKELEESLVGTINNRFEEEYKTKLGVEVSNIISQTNNELLRNRSSAIQSQDKSIKDLQISISKIEQFISHLKDEGLTFHPNFPEDEESELKNLAGDRKMKKASQTDKEEGGEK